MDMVDIVLLSFISGLFTATSIAVIIINKEL